MKRVSFITKNVLCLAIAINLYTTASAQKTDNVQSKSIWVPDTVKIDGNLTEWDILQAYNKSTRIWYTIANNDKHIYLAVRSTDQLNNNKILAGGISLLINTTGKKKDKDAFTITFPVMTGAGGRGMGRRRDFGQQDTPDSAAVIAQQRQILTSSKEISAIGFKDITDTLISIYNEYGIKAAAKIDDKGVFTYELAIPLQMLGLHAGDMKELAYNVKLNGLQLGSTGGFGRGRAGGGGRLGGGGRFDGGGGFGSSSAFGGGGQKTDLQDLTSPTDFWSKYILATGKTADDNKHK